MILRRRMILLSFCFLHSAVRSSCLSPGQVQHGLQDVGPVFGAGFTEQRAVRLQGQSQKAREVKQLVFRLGLDGSDLQSVKLPHRLVGQRMNHIIFFTMASFSPQLVATQSTPSCLRSHLLPTSMRGIFSWDTS